LYRTHTHWNVRKNTTITFIVFDDFPPGKGSPPGGPQREAGLFRETTAFCRTPAPPHGSRRVRTCASSPPHGSRRRLKAVEGVHKGNLQGQFRAKQRSLGIRVRDTNPRAKRVTSSHSTSRESCQYCFDKYTGTCQGQFSAGAQLALD
jgi:hypothetical protein